MTTDKNDSTRERIIEAATQLFARQGYAATGMSRILKRAKASSGSFYYFFDSKEDLLRAVLDRRLEQLQPVVFAPVVEEEKKDPIESIFALLRSYRQQLEKSDCGFACPVGRLALEISPEHREVHRRLATYFERWTAADREVVGGGRGTVARRLEQESARHLCFERNGGRPFAGSYFRQHQAVRSGRGTAARLLWPVSREGRQLDQPPLLSPLLCPP